jgi:chemotaxis family two-component system response regulator PixH
MQRRHDSTKDPSMDMQPEPDRRQLPTALVVEDDMACVYLWRRYMKESGFRPVSTASGKEALELAQCEHPSLVVLDVMLPDVQGWEVLQALKADPATQDIPVIICSGFYEKERSVARGADGYLQKPVLYDDFVRVLAELRANAQGT